MDMVHAASNVPPAHALAALGTVLCTYPTRTGGELGGWARAAHVAHVSALDSDGVRESIAFFDANGRGCWRLYLLPDTDLLAWERLAQTLPARRAEREARSGLSERLWRRWSGDAAAAWHAGVLRLHALPGGPGYATLSILAASQAPLSSVAGNAARRILRSEGVGGGEAIEDCCCRQASIRAASDASQPPVAHADAVPLIHFNVRPHA